ncbi:hypothetical protein CCHR01_00595 [Colletotrichum chrysophilum]|uniref:Uncharacterized protein n=1 Tax=Colletotrichum chrysophilum TaxID=1836956 RepID=A0AAD9ER71_9PEZI|nr:hypothetical protein CCHR01_00595 [Colletotrichum chrysophilum]
MEMECSMSAGAGQGRWQPAAAAGRWQQLEQEQEQEQQEAWKERTNGQAPTQAPKKDRTGQGRRADGHDGDVPGPGESGQAPSTIHHPSSTLRGAQKEWRSDWPEEERGQGQTGPRSCQASACTTTGSLPWVPTRSEPDQSLVTVEPAATNSANRSARREKERGGRQGSSAGPTWPPSDVSLYLSEPKAPHVFRAMPGVSGCTK